VRHSAPARYELIVGTVCHLVPFQPDAKVRWTDGARGDCPVSGWSITVRQE
jgi:hypothetical protein